MFISTIAEASIAWVTSYDPAEAGASEALAILASLVTYLGRWARAALPLAAWLCIRKTAARNALPVDQITRVSVLDPYFYS